MEVNGGCHVTVTHNEPSMAVRVIPYSTGVTVWKTYLWKVTEMDRQELTDTLTVVGGGGGGGGYD